ncbi:MAG: PD40 domain-containing protein [Verrucomicrobia bacterium]|nr:PD40 domain-containing protein [Verrucomicrobiota bacterium]
MPTRHFPALLLLCSLVGFIPLAAAANAPAAGTGYYRFPALHGETLVFTAEGDLWRVAVTGGVAQRLTSHPGQETYPALSPDGQWLAFSAQYEGPTEAYVMPATGGLPRRLTFEGESALVRGWTPEGRVLVSTAAESTLPNRQLVAIAPATLERSIVPLAQADEGSYDEKGNLYFTRLSAQSSHAKRYVGGTAQQLWRFAAGATEATPLTASYAGTSKSPMWWRGRLYFASDRDGTMNLWSMQPDGSDLRQHTRHADFGVKFPALQGGRIAYQNGADLWLLDLASGRNALVPVRLASDFDQTREKWVEKPLDYLTHMAVSPTGNRVALTVRGQVFVAPVGAGRLVEASRQSGVRYRQTAFLPDGKSLLALSDESGEVEFWKLPANGVGPREQVTREAQTLRMGGVVSPDGKWLAYTERDQDLWVHEFATGQARKVASSPAVDFDNPDLAWSPDSRWLAYVMSAVRGGITRILVYNLADDRSTPLTSDRAASSSPAWSPDGKWLYFLSERNLESTVPSPWGNRQPEPFFDRVDRIYQIALTAQRRSPFDPPDELNPADADKAAEKPGEKTTKPGPKTEEKKPDGTAAEGAPAAPATPEKKETNAEPAKDPKAPPAVSIDFAGIELRQWEVPVPAGNLSRLTVTDKYLFYTDRGSGPSARTRLVAVEIKNKEVETSTVLDDIRSYRLSHDRKKLAVLKADPAAKTDAIYVFDAGTKAPDKLDKARVDVAALRFSYAPRENWRQIFTDAWRLHRDYFYDKSMHGVDWRANLAKHLPLVDRVTDRAELNDLIAYLMSELSALHTSVRGGDVREGPDDIALGSLGAYLERDPAGGGWRIARLYRGDPDYPKTLSPLQRPGLAVKEGDVIEAINGIATADVPHPGALLRQKAGRQVLLRLKPAGGQPAYDVVVTPLSPTAAQNLRYDDWELSRRTRVEEAGAHKIGYVHLRAMGPPDIAQWARDFYPIFDREGLILDLRHNRGGNIDSWVLNRLLRKAWMFWAPRDGEPYWNMQGAFRGHLVVLINEWTSSDGETAANGVRRLGLGTLIGTRTWGGGVWLRSINGLVDKGLASAAEFGTYAPEGQWVVEGHGIDPDIVVDNLPHATFRGQDAQLEAAIKLLREKIAADPRPVPRPPPYPNKAK